MDSGRVMANRERYWVHSDPEPTTDPADAPPCSARLCAVCAEPAHTPGEECDAGEACTTDRVHLGMTCRRCYERMARQLRDLPELYVWAGRELTPGAATGNARGTERGIGLRVSALDFRAGSDVLGALYAWERDWRETFEDPAPTVAPRAERDRVGANLVAVCGWLHENLIRTCRAHAAVSVFAGELNDLHAEASVAARVTGRRHVQVDCPTDTEHGRCGAGLRLTGLELHQSVYCRACRVTRDVHTLLLVAATDAESGVWLSGDEVAILLGVPESVLRRWASRDEVQRRSGQYELGSVKDAIRRGASRSSRGA